MIGICEIASYIPPARSSNYEQKEAFGIDDQFIEGKIGVRYRAQLAPDEKTSDLCVRAYQALKAKIDIDDSGIQALAVVTQNPDCKIPHTSAIVHGKLGLPEECACFDISLGCSGYVHGLSILQSFMLQNELSRGVLITCDPYSRIINRADKNTALLFGDAAAATYLSDAPLYCPGKFVFGTSGREYRELICEEGALQMNGRGVFNFTVRSVPESIRKMLALNMLDVGQVDAFVLHQGSKYIIDTITDRMALDPAKVHFDMYDYGNTVSSSIPIILEKIIPRKSLRTIVVSGFGVGLALASGVLRRA